MGRFFARQIWVLAIALMAIGGCAWPNRARSDCSGKLASLMVISGLLADSWNIASLQRDYLYDSGSIDRCSVFFTFVGGGGYQEVYEYSTRNDAQLGFDRLRTVAFPENPSYDTPWTVDSDLVLDNLSADDFVLACSKSGDRERCQFLARYDTVNLLFFSHLVDNAMSIADFRYVVRKLDGLVGQQLQESQ